MFNIQFGGSNSAQVPGPLFDTTGSGDIGNFEALYYDNRDKILLSNFLCDVRTMSDTDFTLVMTKILDR